MSDFTITNAAQAAAQRSIDAVRAKNKEAWVANFADDACIEDPVGKSPLDATACSRSTSIIRARNRCW
jgi:hypothetical protein